MKSDRTKSITFLHILLIAAVLELFLAYTQDGFSIDLEFIHNWGVRMHEVGFSRFYGPEVQMPYPPGYLYVVFVLQWVINLLQITDISIIYFIYKIPPIFCDLCSGVILYKLALERQMTKKKATVLAALYMFNPAVVINSAVWGQVDSCFTLFILLMCLFLSKKKFGMACLMFGIGMMVKQQTMAFAPVLLWGLIDQTIIDDKFSLNKLGGVFLKAF